MKKIKGALKILPYICLCFVITFGLMTIVGSGGGGGGVGSLETGGDIQVTITLTATAVSSTEIDLSWTEVSPTPSQYRIYMNGENYGFFLGTSIIIGNLNPNTQYCFKVYASYFPIGITDGSNQACATTLIDIPPAVPTNLNTIAVSPGQIDLQWDASTDDYGVTGYNIYRDGTYLKSVTGTSTSDTGLNPVTDYCYTVSAYDTVGNESAQSSQACETTPPDFTPPTTPTNFVAVAVSADQIDLSWSPSTDDGVVSGYKIFRNGMYIQNTTDTSFSDTGLNSNTQYCYTVSAFDAAGNESALSDQACLVTSWTITSIHAKSTLGMWTSIAVDSADNAHISYYENMSIGPNEWIGNLTYATNVSGSWVAETVYSSGSSMGYDASIALDSFDKVHISFSVGSLGGLKYATNVSGSWVVDTIDTNNGFDTSIAVDSANNVCISYIGSGDLKYVTNTSGSWVIDTIGSSNCSGCKISIAVDSSDKVHISYYDSTNQDLKYATNVSGSWIPDTVDSQGDVGRYSSIALDSSDKVHMSYYDSTNEDLKYATNVSGSWEIYTIDSSAGINGYTSIAIDSEDNIHISYQIYTSVRYATNR